MIEKPTFIDLFCGAGGLSLGFKKAGYEPLWALDKDEVFACTYRKNFDVKVFEGDIRGIANFRPKKSDVIVGGPPCQGFSPLGKMNRKKERTSEHEDLNTLWREFFRAIHEIGPKAFVVENVPGFLKSEEFNSFYGMVKKEGYNVVYGVLKAEEFGVPQKRSRAFTIGIMNGSPSLPPPTQIRKSVRDAIGDLPLEPDGKGLHIGRNPTAISLERYRLIPPGGNRFDLMRLRPDLCPPCWMKKKTGSTDVFGRLEWDKPSLTIRTEFFKPEKGRYLHPQADRPITHREAARLQTFPDDYVFCGSKTQIAKQIGNAVPPELALHVAMHLKKLLQDVY